MLINKECNPSAAAGPPFTMSPPLSCPVRLPIVLFVILCAMLGVLPFSPSGRAAPAELHTVYAERARRTERFTAARLAYPPQSSACEPTRPLTFRRELDSPLSDAWHLAAQLAADGALAAVDGTPFDCRAWRTVAFLDRLARQPSGYYPRANLDGGGVTRSEVFADDNAYIGLALLDARQASADPALRAALLQRATGAARFLIDGGLWDDTFGGGFWWNSSRGAVAEGKPTQSTALAALLFARLHELTGDPEYARWARVSLDWLDARLLDPSTGLYAYGLSHAEPVAGRGERLDTRVFGYDQGIVIEVHLAFERGLEPGVGHLEMARALADRLETAFRDPEVGGYRLNAAMPEVYTIYAAWVSVSLLDLYAVDPDPIWLERARANLDDVEGALLDASDGGYFNMRLLCRSPGEAGCEAGDRWAVDPTKVLAAQALMQRSQAMLASALARSGA